MKYLAFLVLISTILYLTISGLSKYGNPWCFLGFPLLLPCRSLVFDKSVKETIKSWGLIFVLMGAIILYAIAESLGFA